jgi:hypothetical protein
MLAVGRVIEKKWQERNWAGKEDFMCDLKLQCDCYDSVARKRLVEDVLD